MRDTTSAEDQEGWQIAMHHENVNVFIVNATSDRLLCNQHAHAYLTISQSPLLERDTIIIAYLGGSQNGHYCPVFKQGTVEKDDIFKFQFADTHIQNIHDNYRICCQIGDREHVACKCGELDEFDGYVIRNIPECVKVRDIRGIKRPDLIRLAKQCGVPRVGENTGDFALYGAVNAARGIYETSRSEVSDMLNINTDAAMDLIDRFRSIPNILRGDMDTVKNIVKGRYASIEKFLEAFQNQRKIQKSQNLTDYETSVLLLSNSGSSDEYMIDSIHLKYTFGTDIILAQFGKMSDQVEKALTMVLSTDVVQYSLALENIARNSQKRQVRNKNFQQQPSREDVEKQKEMMIQEKRIKHADNARTEQARMDDVKHVMATEKAAKISNASPIKCKGQSKNRNVNASSPYRPCENMARNGSEYCRVHEPV